MRKKNYKRILAVIGTVTLLAGNMGAVSTSVLAGASDGTQTEDAQDSHEQKEEPSENSDSADNTSAPESNDTGSDSDADQAANDGSSAEGQDASETEKENSSASGVDSSSTDEDYSTEKADKSADNEETGEENGAAASDENAEKPASGTNTDKSGATDNSGAQSSTDTNGIDNNGTGASEAADPSETGNSGTVDPSEAGNTAQNADEHTITVTYAVNDENAGYIQDAAGNKVTEPVVKTYTGEESEITFDSVTAVPNDGYSFVKWQEIDSDNPELTKVFSDDVLNGGNVEETYTAVFKSDAESDDAVSYYEGTLKDSVGDARISVTVKKDAEIPEDAELNASKIDEDSEEYSSLLAQAKEEKSDDLSFAQFYDIKIVSDGKEIEPAAPVDVAITLDNSVAVADNGSIDVLHFTDDAVKSLAADTDGKDYDTMTEVSKVSFTTPSFSTFGLLGTNAYATVNLANVGDTNTNEKLSVEAHLNRKDGEAIGTDGKVEISYGPLNKDKVQLDGYQFADAWFRDIQITGIYKSDNGKVTYVTVEGNSVTGIDVTDYSGDIKIVFVQSAYKVTYTVTVNGEPVTDYSNIISIAGATEYQTGREYKFVLTPVTGYSISEVKAKNGIVKETDTTNKEYLLSDVTGDTEISVALDEKKTYDFYFNGSNTTLIESWKNQTEHTHYGQKKGPNPPEWAWKSSYTAETKLSFQLRGWNEWTDNAKILNHLSICIDGADNAAQIPDKTGKENAVSTSLSNGCTVTVIKINERYYPTYDVVITGPNDGTEKVRGDIKVQTNFKDYDSSEIWARQLDGVDPLAYHYVKDESTWFEDKKTDYWVKDDNKGDQNSRLQPDVYTYVARTRNYDYDFYVKLKKGYSAEDLFLYVKYYAATRVNDNYHVSEIGDIISRKPLSQLLPLTKKEKENVGDYTYKFTVPADHGKTKYYDIRIFIRYEPDLATKYTVWFAPDNGVEEIYRQGKTDGYALEDNTPLSLSEIIPKQKVENGIEYVFDGWYLKDDPDTIYKPGALFTINSDTAKYADKDTHRYMFKAHWIRADQTHYAEYKVNVFFQKDDGTYANQPDLTTTERGNKGSTAYLIPKEFNNWLEKKKPDLNRWEYYRQKTSGEIIGDGKDYINVYYRLKTNTLTVTKKVTSKFSSYNGPFEFTLKLTYNNSDYHGDFDGAKNKGNGIYTFELSNDGSVSFELPAGITYTVTEDSEGLSGKGLVPLYQNGINASPTKNPAKGQLDKDITVAVQNSTTIVKTGINDSAASVFRAMVLMADMAAAAGVIYHFVRRRMSYR